MTDIMEARRKGFEAWVLREADNRKYAHMAYVISKNEDGSYLTTWVDCAWMGYNAALDSVCVKLPDKKEGIGVGKGYLAIDFENGYNHAIARCELAIERAGLKVKP